MLQSVQDREDVHTVDATVGEKIQHHKLPTEIPVQGNGAVRVQPF